MTNVAALVPDGGDGRVGLDLYTILPLPTLCGSYRDKGGVGGKQYSAQ